MSSFLRIYISYDQIFPPIGCCSQFCDLYLQQRENTHHKEERQTEQFIKDKTWHPQRDSHTAHGKISLHLSKYLAILLHTILPISSLIWVKQPYDFDARICGSSSTLCEWQVPNTWCNVRIMLSPRNISPSGKKEFPVPCFMTVKSGFVLWT